MLKRAAIILVATTLTVLTGAAPVVAYDGDTYEELIEDETLTDQHAIIIRFYAAVFGRTPDNDGVRFWLDQYDTGEWSTRQIANFFATSDEFKDLYGEDTTNTEFVDSVYPNVLGRQPDANGRTFWIGYLDDGNSRAEMILLVSNAPEFIDANRLPFEPDVSACALDVFVTTDQGAVPIDGDEEFVKQPVSIITTASADCGQVAGFVGTIGWVGGTTISEGSLTDPGSVEEATMGWRCVVGQVARIEWSIQPIEILNGEQRLGTKTSGSTQVQCNEASLTPMPEQPLPQAECLIFTWVNDEGPSEWIDENANIASQRITLLLIDSIEACSDLPSLAWVGEFAWVDGDVIFSSDTPTLMPSTITFDWVCTPDELADVRSDILTSWDGSEAFAHEVFTQVQTVGCSLPGP